MIALVSTYIKKTNGVINHYEEKLVNFAKEINNGNPYGCDSVKGEKKVFMNV